MEGLPTVIGPYRVTRLLGEGGMGTIFEAVHEVIKRRVAVKVLHPAASQDPEALSRFLNEARATNLVNHPGLVQVTDFGNLPDGSGFLVMEYLEGETLSRRLENSGARLSTSDAVQIAMEIATAVAAAHRKGIIHRDLKPSNVMLVPDSAMPTGERVKVLDFGLAKLRQVDGAAVVRTTSQAVLGTPLYMSPEQCEGAGRVGAKSDVYSLGCVLYEMLAGRPPFLGQGMGQVIGLHLYKTPEPLQKLVPSLPAPLAQLIDEMLVKSMDDRPGMSEVQHRLEAMAATLPPLLRRLNPGDSAAVMESSMAASRKTDSSFGYQATEAGIAKPARRTRLRVAVACSLLGLLTGGVILFQQRTSLSPRKPRAAAALLPGPAAPEPAPSRPLQPAPATPPTPVLWTAQLPPAKQGSGSTPETALAAPKPADDVAGATKELLGGRSSIDPASSSGPPAEIKAAKVTKKSRGFRFADKIKKKPK